MGGQEKRIMEKNGKKRRILGRLFEKVYAIFYVRNCVIFMLIKQLIA